MFNKRVIAICLLVSLMFFAQTASAMENEDLAEEQRLIFGVNFEDLGGMDPHLAPTTIDKMAVDPQYNGLFRFKPGRADIETIEPDLVEEWQVSEDGKTWTFKLREGVEFHHGYGELTSEDVKFSLEKAADPETSAFSADFDFIEEINIVDDYTFEIITDHAYSEEHVTGFLTDYQGGMIVSKEAVEAHGEDFRMNPAGTGPFKLKEYRSRQHLILERHEDYFRGEPILEEIEIRFVPEASALQMAFEGQELDIIEGLREEWWLEDIEQPGVISEIVGPGELMTIHFNLGMEPIDDIRVRQAIAHAIDKEELMEAIGEGITEEAHSPVPPGYYAHTDEVRRYEYDPDKVEELLEEAGYPEGVELGEVAHTDMAIMLTMMEMVQAQLERHNISFDIRVVDHATYHEMIRDDLNPLVNYGAARFPTPDQYLTQFYHSRSSVLEPTAVTNFSHYGKLIDGVDDLIDGARIEADADKQYEMWVEAQKQIMEDLAAYPIYNLLIDFQRWEYVDLGYEFENTMNLTPQFTENTRILDN